MKQNNLASKCSFMVIFKNKFKRRRDCLDDFELGSSVIVNNIFVNIFSPAWKLS